MRILFSHNAHPAQFRRLIPALVERGHEVVFLAQSNEWHAPEVEGYRLIPYQQSRSGGGPAIHPYLRRLESAVLHGQAVFRAAQGLRDQGWSPDVVVSHVGFGNGLYLSDCFPEARRVGFFEWFYRADGPDLAYLHPDGISTDHRLRLRGWNAMALLELASVDVAVTPTQWQCQQFPAWMQSRFAVIHEGIDVDHFAALRSAAPPPPPPFGLPDDPAIEVVTFLSRAFEEYRGLPQAMRALVALQQQRPHLHLLLAGSDAIAYGKPRSDGRSWRQWAIDELPLDPKRTHWLGILHTEQYEQLLACSDLHLYLTVPFVLSWSLLEAMAAGCCIVASDTEPVREVMRDQVSGALVPFFDEQRITAAMASLLDAPDQRQALAQGAQRAAERFDVRDGNAAWIRLLCEDTD